MIEETNTRWYVIQTQHRREGLAAASVRGAGLPVLLPMARKARPSRRDFTIRPLFPSYLFARFCARRELHRVRYLFGIVRVLGSKSLPTPIDDEIVASIRASTSSDGHIHLQPCPIRPGDQVTVEHGPFRGLVGRVQRELNDGKRVLLLLDAIREAQVIVEKPILSPAAEA